MRIITLLTDFGFEDPYVGIMKGVILKLNPTVRLVDLTHSVEPGNIRQAACALRDSFHFFPESTIHVAVVDPGVGTRRRPILVQSRGHLFVGPDNGLFWPLLKDDPRALMVHLTKEMFFLPVISNTFHGRDIFAPVAGHLSLGADPLEMGDIIQNPVTLPDMEATQEGDALVGRISRVDHFGNVVTNVHRDELVRFLGDRQAIIRVAGKTINGIAQTYADGPEGELLALFGSTGHLEIAVNSGRADRHLGLRKTDGLLAVKIERAATGKET